ncbi:MAG: hypothetical protein ACTSYI_03610 [Promethearchaeota archaeon]
MFLSPAFPKGDNKQSLEQIGVDNGRIVKKITEAVNPIKDGDFPLIMDTYESMFIGKIMISSKWQ